MANMRHRYLLSTFTRILFLLFLFIALATWQSIIPVASQPLWPPLGDEGDEVQLLEPVHPMPLPPIPAHAVPVYDQPIQIPGAVPISDSSGEEIGVGEAQGMAPIPQFSPPRPLPHSPPGLIAPPPLLPQPPPLVAEQLPQPMQANPAHQIGIEAPGFDEPPSVEVVYNRRRPDYKCGVSRMGIPARRILNGVKSIDGDWPWVAHLSSGCTGSIISRRHVLSAAHCAFNETEEGPVMHDFRHFTIMAGTLNGHPQERPESGRRYLRHVRRVFIHPDYSYPDFASPDLAIFELAEAMPFDGWVEKICLPAAFKEHYGQIAHIVGWGADNRTDNYTRTYYAQEQMIPLNHPSKCMHHLKRMAPRHQPMDFNRLRFICGGGRFKGTETGDSGAPLMMNEKGRWYQVGLTSFGEIGSDERGLYDVGAYTRIAEHCTWIEQVTDGEVQCVDMEQSPPRENSDEENDLYFNN